MQLFKYFHNKLIISVINKYCNLCLHLIAFYPRELIVKFMQMHPLWINCKLLNYFASQTCNSQPAIFAETGVKTKRRKC